MCVYLCDYCPAKVWRAVSSPQSAAPSGPPHSTPCAGLVALGRNEEQGGAGTFFSEVERVVAVGMAGC